MESSLSLHKQQEHILITQALAGKQAAWLQLIAEYEQPIYNLGIRMLGQRADALDLVQDVFIILYEKLQTFREQASLKHWILTIAHHQVISYIRKQSKLTPWEAIHETHSTADHLTEEIQQQQENQWIVNALKQLSFEQRWVVELKVYQELTFQEIAEQLLLSSNTIKTRFYSAIKQIRELESI